MPFKREAIYRDYAKYYDLIYSWKDYQKETKFLARLIARYKRSEGNRLLDVACGTGKHLEYLQEHFTCVGVDVSPAVLRIAAKRLPNVKFITADMSNLSIKGSFDVITCLFSAIGYVKSPRLLEKTLDGFAKLLNPGGVVVIEPWIAREQYKTGLPHLTIHNGIDVKIARVVVSQLRGNLSIMDMHYLVGEKDRPGIHFIDRHEMLLSDHQQILVQMRQSGLRAVYLKTGLSKDRGLIIGVKPR